MRAKSYIIILSLILMLALITSIAYADHTTCRENPDGFYENCETNLDWDYIFDEIAFSSDDRLSDDGYGSERALFKQPNIALSEDIDTQLTEEYGYYMYQGYGRLGTDIAGQWQGFHQSTPLYASEEITGIEDEENSESFIYQLDHSFSSTHDEGENPTVVEYPPDSARLFAYVPDENNTYIELTIERVSGEPRVLDTVKIYPDDTQRADNESLELVDVDLDIDNEISDFEYHVEVELNRNNSNSPSPVIDAGIVLERQYPEYRTDASSYDNYPEELSILNNRMYMEAANNIISQSGDSSVISPRYDGETYQNKETTSEFTGNAFENSYVKIDNIEPSVKSPTDAMEKEWDVIANNSGNVYITYDSSIGDSPSDYTPSEPEEGDIRYEYSSSGLSYEIDFGYERLQDEGLDFIKLDSKESSSGGVKKFEYDTESINKENFINFASEMKVSKEYTKTEYEYVPNIESCPLRMDVRDDLPSECDGEFGSGECSYVEVSPDGCYSPEDEYQDGLKTEFYNSEEIAYSDTLTDRKYIDRFASEDSPRIEDFDVELLSMPGETRAYVNRNLEEIGGTAITEYDFDSTRWSNIQSNGITLQDSISLESINSVPESSKRFEESIYIGNQAGLDDNLNNPQALQGEITEDMDVKLDVWAEGSFSNNHIETEIEGNQIDSSTAIFTDENTGELQRIIQNENISEEVIGENQIDLSFELNNEIESHKKVWYMVSIDLNEPINQINSRWNYFTLRDTAWDSIYEFTESCEENEDCYNYREHGIPPENTPNHVNTEFPSGALPLQAHILPTTNTLETELTQHSRIDDVNIHSTEQSNINTPIRSSYCADYMDTDSTVDTTNTCNLYNPYIASNIIEDSLIEDSPEYNEFGNVDAGYEESILSALKSTSPSSFEQLNPSIDFYSLTDMEPRGYNEATEFEIYSDTPIQHLSIAGNATWKHEDLDTDDIRFGDTTNIRLTELDLDSIPSERRSEMRDETPDNNRVPIPGQLEDNEVLLRVELTDGSENPIHTNDRNTEDRLVAERANKQDDFGEPIYGEQEIDTNEEGIAYITVFRHEDKPEKDEDIEIRFESVDKWWELPSDVIYYESSSSNMFPPVEEPEAPSGATVWDLIVTVITLFISVFVILALFMRVNPQSNVTTTDLAKTATDAFRGDLIKFTKYMFLFIMITLTLSLFALFL